MEPKHRQSALYSPDGAILTRIGLGTAYVRKKSTKPYCGPRGAMETRELLILGKLVLRA